MSAPVRITSPEQEQVPGKSRTSEALRREAEGTYFLVDEDAGTLTWNHYKGTRTAMRLPGHTEPAGLPAVARVVVVTMLNQLLGGDHVSYLVFVDPAGRCVHRAGLYMSVMLNSLWPVGTLEGLERFGITVERSTARNYHDLNRQFPGASRHWLVRSPLLFGCIIAAVIVALGVVAILIAVHASGTS